MLRLQAIVYCGGLLFAAAYDLKHRKVLNIVWLVIAMAGLTKVSLASVIGAIVGWLPFYLCAGFGRMGPGDWKLTAAVGFVLGAGRLFAGYFFIIIVFLVQFLIRQMIPSLRDSENPKQPLVPYLAAGFIPAYFL